MPIKHLKYQNDDELITKTSGTFKNFPANDDNLEQLKGWLESFKETCKFTVSSELSEDKIKERESILGIKFPTVLRLIHLAIGNNQEALSAKEETKLINFRLLNIDEIKIEKGIIIYDPYKDEQLYETDILIYGLNLKGKNFYAIDLNKDWDLVYSKKWFWVKDGMPLYENILVLLACLAIANRKYVFKTNIKGVSSVKTIETVNKKFAGNFEQFNKFEHYGHTLYFNKKIGALGWLRAGNSCPQILIGSDNKQFMDEIIVKYGFDKIKTYK